MQYINIRIVDVVPMTLYYAMEHGYYLNDSDGVYEGGDDGYEVTYENGYKTWYSKEKFEKYHFENKGLAKTAMLMSSSDYKDRFRAEYIQLENRYYGLKKMIENWDAGTLSFTPTCPREIYDEQLAAMKAYMKVLSERAHIENISIYG